MMLMSFLGFVFVILINDEGIGNKFDMCIMFTRKLCMEQLDVSNSKEAPS